MPDIEVGTEDKVVAVGGENGIVAIIQIMDRDVVNQIKLDSGIFCRLIFPILLLALIP